MSTSVWVDFFRNGEPSCVSQAGVVAAFGEFLHRGDDGLWRAYYGLNHYCEVYLCEDENDATLSQGVLVTHPLRDIRLWDALYKIMLMGNSLLINPSSEPMMIASKDTIKHLPPEFPNPDELELVNSGSEIVAAFNALRYDPRAALTQVLQEQRRRRATGDRSGFGMKDAENEQW
jgi:hypothetical protein